MNGETIELDKGEVIRSAVESRDQRFFSHREKNTLVDRKVDTLLLYDEKSVAVDTSGKFYKPPTVEKSNAENEHSATTEASISSESLIEDMRDNDNESVYSDIASISSKPSKTDVKQYVRLLARIKNENMLLKETLEKTNMTDIVTLKTSLRGARADIVQLRQYNSELKDRVQILELRLFNALSDVAQSDSQSEVTPDSNKERGGRQSNEDVIVKPWKSKCGHLSRLVKSYERKIEELERELEKHIQDSRGNNKREQLDPARSKEVLDLQSRLSSLETQREIDQRVIRELTSELKSISAREENVLPVGGTSDGVESKVNDSVGDTTVAVVNDTSEKKRTDSMSKYSENQLLLSFVAGLLVMLVCSLFAY